MPACNGEKVRPAPIRVSVLGSTGSIGRSTLDVLRRSPGRFTLVGLAAHSNVDLLAEQIAEFGPTHAAVLDEAAAARLDTGRVPVQRLSGPEGLEHLAALPADVTVCAVVGAAGLRPLLRAIDAGNRIALANKEALVMAGELVMRRARERDVDIVPVDSEHSAIFQCLQGQNADDVRCIHLTASGGPFYGRPRESLADVSPDEAMNHPTWAMGSKISVDSATLMNKGLEVIEAMRLFDLPLSKVNVLIHPQSVVHGLVEFTDGNILAHLGVTDMRFPIAFALAWPERVESPLGRLDLTSIQGLTFAAPDVSAFPCLRLALRAAERGGTAPATMNAANEVAVEAFCQGRIGFLEISEVVEHVLADSDTDTDVSLESVVSADAVARQKAREAVDAAGKTR